MVCGYDGDEEFIFSGSDDDLGMDDLDDNGLSEDSEGDETIPHTYGTTSDSLPGDDEPVEQSGSLPSPIPGPSGLQPHSSRQQSLLLAPAPTLASPPRPSQPQSRSRGRGRRAQPSRSAGEESNDDWSKEPSDVTVQPFTMDVGPTFELSADPTQVFLHFFPPQLVDLIVLETNRYAALCLSSTANTSGQVQAWETNPDEIKAYLGFHILMGLVHLPDLSDYWVLDECYHYFP